MPGYAIEYDSIVPTQLKPTLETKKFVIFIQRDKLNGTSGYEEAAGQGLMAGVNAAARALEKKNDYGRSEGYIGVLLMISVTKGTNEPYSIANITCRISPTPSP